MALDKKQFSSYIRQFNFRELFNDMGWNNDKTTQAVVVDNETHTLQAVAEKCGLKILTCQVENLPQTPTQKKLDTQIRKLFYHYLLICTDAEGKQKWIIPIKKSEGRSIVTIDYAGHQVPEFLFQKVSQLTFSFEQEEHLTIVDVSKLIHDTFVVNSEKITRQFYDKFKKEHTSFLAFIKGISDKADREWYASLMLNRLMFCYFIQKKGFLDNNKNYLRDKLLIVKDRKGKNNFYSFYRGFLLVLFHKGLNEPPESRKRLNETEVEIGKIPYLNGGLFDEHELEKNNAKIDIDDKAFERLFDFFDQYEWHLDTRVTATGKDINPDVIGYIFEKYINDRAQMGAYYTKEDITDYISKNCILPYLFDETKRQYPKAFDADAQLWQMVKQSDDLYIYDAVKKGVELPLPDEIEIGVDTAKPDLIERRKAWNTSAPAEYALPTEIWREVVDRRKRYTEVKNKIDKGEIQHINDFITYNLNIRQFAQDAIENTNDPEFLKYFYKALNNVTILDPACGSGAFLFAAMNILEPLYEACLNRMEAFIEEAKDENNYKHLLPELRKSWKSVNHKKSWFRQCLEDVKNPQHPNLSYFIYKSIILRNLYGVDIMKEAVEIAKLRLFLKLVATVEADYRKPNLGLEPLPDIDFNIRSGNTLVGFATEAELNNAFEGVMDFDSDQDKIKEKCEVVANAFKRYKEIQLTYGDDFNEFKKAKADLNERLKELNHELNTLLAKQYGVEYNKNNPKIIKSYESWFRQYLPFHWFAEFYEIVHEKGGFDVIIGNPPYLEVRQIDYKPKLSTYASGAVHNMCIERSLQIFRKDGNISMIVPLALVCTQRMITVQNLLENGKKVWYSNFAWRPAKLFDEVNRALTIFVANHSSIQEVFNTGYLKWSSDTRENLFPNISFVSWNEKRNSFWSPKLSNNTEKLVLNKVIKSDKSISFLITKQSTNRVYYRTTGGLYWKIFTNFSPKFFVNGKEGKSSRETYFSVVEKNQDVICIALLSSNLFWWWYTVTSNLRDLNPSDIQGFKFPSSVLKDTDLLKLGKKYLKELDDNSTMLTRIQKQTGETQTQSFKIALSKETIDEIDRVLADHYGFTEEELDFIINYDIKYRMGKLSEPGLSQDEQD